jgi:chromosome partitioning protein
MIIIVGGIKGGSGKTTIATNLAVIRAHEGKNVLLIDADDQETSYDFSTLRNGNTEELPQYTCIKLTGKPVRTEVLKMKKNYDEIIIDTGGRDTISQRAALSVADILLVPFVPRSFDLWTLEAVSAIVEEIKQINPNIRSYAFLNRADSRGLDNTDAQDCIKETQNIKMLQDCIICSRKAFGNAAAEGKSVLELKVQDKKAIIEITSLYDYLFHKKDPQMPSSAGLTQVVEE